MCTHDHKIQIDILFVQNEIVTNKVKYGIQHQIAPPTNRIPIRFQGHKAPEQKVEGVNKVGEGIFHCKSGKGSN